MQTAKIGGTAKGGICRLTLTELDRNVRDWFKVRAQELGCTVSVDDMGAMFARRPGQRADIPPIGIGSHLDTQPSGGKFDGTLGVLAALEALRTLRSAGYETFAPIEVDQLDQRGRFALLAADDRFRRLRRRVRARVGARTHRPRRRDIRRRAAKRSAIAARSRAAATALGLFRAAHRTGAVSRSRGQGDRRRHRRAGDALVRSNGHRPGQPRWNDADAAPP